MMNRAGKIIIALLIFGVLLFCAVELVIIPHMDAEREAYNAAQNDSVTHDITNVLKYKSAYIGDNSNDANLFYHLPLNSVPMKFEIDPDTCALTVNYLDTVSDIGADKVRRDLVYNSAAAMALIGNLSKITYEFPGESFVFTREEIEFPFGGDLSAFLDKDAWDRNVQSRLNDTVFVDSFYPEG